MHSEQSYLPRIVFLGSGPFALPVLDALGATYRVVGVVTQPDRPVGRGRTMVRGAVAVRGDKLGIPVLQPSTFRNGQAPDQIRRLEPDLLAVASYGRILPESVLAIPRHGALNVHPSLLPRHRGPSPVASTILAGDSVTGVTIMKIVAQMDAGPVVARTEEAVREADTTESLTTRLAPKGASLLVESIPAWLDGSVKAMAQDETQATYSRILTKEDGRIDWTKPVGPLAREVRAFNPWPVSHTTWQDRALRIFMAKPFPERRARNVRPGQVVTGPSRSPCVQTRDGVLLLEEVQAAGGRRMAASEFARGHPDLVGALLGC